MPQLNSPPTESILYCSGVCCTYTQKQVILTKNHHSDGECTICHNDFRAYSKGFERFYTATARRQQLAISDFEKQGRDSSRPV